MMAAIVDRRRLKEETRELLRTAQVSSRGMTALYLGILVVLSLVNSLTSSGVTSLILDLRDNEGEGAVKAMARIADVLLPEGVIVSARYKDGSVEVLERSDVEQVAQLLAAFVEGLGEEAEYPCCN